MTATAVPDVQRVADPPAATGPRFTGRWLGPLAVTVLGGVLRFQELARPNAFVFDETYYAKDGLSLLEFGYEQGFVEQADDKILSSPGAVDPTGSPASRRSSCTPRSASG